MIELNIVEASWSMDASGSWLKLKPEFPAQARMVAGELDPRKRYTVAIKEFRKMRSRDANRYLWLLCNKLSVKVGALPEEIYRHYIPDVGDNSDTICAPDAAVKRFREWWEARGLGWCTEIMASKIPGCTNVICYYGSSTYDTKQMARLIDLVVEDCKQQGIETLPPEELERMALEWRQDEKGNEGDKDT